MRRLPRWLLLAVAVVVVCSTVFLSVPTGRKGESATNDVLRRYADASRKHDTARLAALYAEDAILLPPNQKRISGSYKIREFWQTHIAGSLNLIPVSTALQHGAGFVAGWDTFGEGVDSGKSIVGLRQRRDGMWEITADLWNTDSPVAHEEPRVPIVLAGAHQAQVEGLAFSPDARLLASADNGGRLVLWDLASRTAVQTLTGVNFTEVVFTPDGKRIAAAGFDRAVRVWKVTTGELLRTLNYPAQVESIDISPDGRLIAAGGADHAVHFWDLETGKELVQLVGHSDDVYSGKFSPQGRHFASGGRDRSIRIWDVRTGKQLRILTAHDDSVYAIAWSKDGRWLASACRDGSVKVWNTSTWTGERTLNGHTDSVHGVAFNPNASRIATAGFDSTVRLWNASSGSLLQILTGHTKKVADVAFSPDGRWLASASSDYSVRLWSVR